MDKYISRTFWIVIVAFVVVIGEMFVPVMQGAMQGKIFLVPIALFAVANAVLVWFAWQSSVKGRRRFFLLLTGISGVGFFVGVVLHNVFYAFSTLATNVIVIKYFFDMLHVGSFLIAIIICPIGFLIGASGSMWHLIKKK